MENKETFYLDEDGELLDVTDEKELAEIQKFLEEYGE